MRSKFTLVDVTDLDRKKKYSFFQGKSHEMPVCVEEIHDTKNRLLEQNHKVVDRIIIKLDAKNHSTPNDFCQHLNTLLLQQGLDISLEMLKNDIDEYVLKFPYFPEQPDLYSRILDIAKKINLSARSPILKSTRFTMMGTAERSFIREKNAFHMDEIEANCLKLSLDPNIWTPDIFLEKFNQSCEQQGVSISFPEEPLSIDTNGVFTLFFDSPKQPADFFLIMSTARQIVGQQNVHTVKYTKQITEAKQPPKSVEKNPPAQLAQLIKNKEIKITDFFDDSCVADVQVEFYATEHGQSKYIWRTERLLDKQGKIMQCREMLANNILIDCSEDLFNPKEALRAIKDQLKNVDIDVSALGLNISRVPHCRKFCELNFPHSEDDLVLFYVILEMARIVNRTAEPNWSVRACDKSIVSNKPSSSNDLMRSVDDVGFFKNNSTRKIYHLVATDPIFKNPI